MTAENSEAAAIEAGEGGRDEPPGAGAATWRITEKPECQVSHGSTRALVADYLALCKNPLSNLSLWLATSEPGPTAGDRIHAQKETRHDDANAGTIHQHTLPAMRGGMDADERGGQAVDRLPFRSEPGHADVDDMRSVRADDTAADRDSVAPIEEEDAGEADALRMTYAARIAAARLTTPKHARRAATKVLRDEQKAAMRELTRRRQERRKARRFAARRGTPPSQHKPKPLR